MNGIIFLPYNSRRAAALVLVILFALATVVVTISGVQAMTTTSNSSSSISSSSRVQPYTGGASVSKVIYPADGSTVTITSTGAVIKQSPGHTPYRQGWISVCDLGSISTMSDLKGRLASGSKNPYSSDCQQNNNQPGNRPSSNNNFNPPVPNVSSSANATSNANVTLAGTSPTYSSSGQTSANQETPAAQNQYNSSGKSLPNTGPGNVLAISGLTTVFATIGHIVYQRFRYRFYSG